MEFTERQKEFLDDYVNGRFDFINILVGSVGSGKTYISVIPFLMSVITSKNVTNFIMIGKTLDALERNVLQPIQNIFPEFEYTKGNKRAKYKGKVIALEGANDAKSENKIRGMSIEYAYIDELTLVPKEFFLMLISRMRGGQNPYIIATTNPDHSRHYIKTDFIDTGKAKTFDFYLHQNTFLPKTYVDNLQSIYTGVFRQRFLENKWVNAEGLVYPQNFKVISKDEFSEAVEASDIAYIFVGIDFGGVKAYHAMVAVVITYEQQHYVVKDVKYKSDITATDLSMNVLSFLRAVEKLVPDGKTIDAVYTDHISTLLYEIIKVCVEDTENEFENTVFEFARKMKIENRIQYLQNLIINDNFFVLEQCNNVIDTLQSVVYNEKKVDTITRLDDASATEYIDTIDALDYAIEYGIVLYKE